MSSSFMHRYGCLLSLLLLVGCNATPTGLSTIGASEGAAGEPSGQTQADQAEDGSLSATKPEAVDSKDAVYTKDKPKPIAPALIPGEYCYQANSDDQDLYARVTVDAADRITGDFQGTIHDDKNSYYTSYRQKLDGTIDGSNLNLDVATWIEFDKQNSQETWKVTAQGLSTERETLRLESCDVVDAVFQQDGLDARDLLDGANQIWRKEVFFDAGKSGTIVSNAVVRGDLDLYTLSAQGGQQMALSISSLENNAVFDVVAPSGIILVREAVQESIYLPDTGQYEIIVGGTRGNATYELKIAIE
ncbi:MAG: hypothetical protein AAF703_23890 [Cyanobacteria bacterium P01_D01_bin.105]